VVVKPRPNIATEESKLTERMDILQTRESIEDSLELLTESLLGIFDLTGVETCRGKIFSAIWRFFHARPTKLIGIVPLIRLILKPARICVGNCR
jgi:hypothetical protein